jgi:hypothetical protein
MAKINQAYQILHDPHRRWEYDEATVVESEAPRPQPSARPQSSSYSTGTTQKTTQSAYSSGTQTTQSARPAGSQFVREAAEQAAQRQASQTAAASHVDRERAAWARTANQELLRFTALPALAAGVAEAFFGDLTVGPSRLLFDLTMFIPVYFFCVGLAFMWDPTLRLYFADIVRHHRTTPAERAGALAVVASVIPLALLWVAFVRLR